jgi:hypothetical protein
MKGWALRSGRVKDEYELGAVLAMDLSQVTIYYHAS